MSGPAPIVSPYPFTGGAILVPRGKARRFRFQVTDRLTLLPSDLTLWTAFKFLAKNNLLDADAAAVITKSLGVGITLPQPALGFVEVLLVAADTSSLADQTAHLFAEFQGADPAALPWTLWQGELDIVTTVVQAAS